MKTRKHGLTEREQELVKLLMSECESTSDIQDKLKRLFAGTIEQMLEAEMDEHLGYEKHSVAGNNSGNSRNGYGKKQSAATTVSAKLQCLGIETANLNRGSLRSGRHARRKLKRRLWRCMPRG